MTVLKRDAHYHTYGDYFTWSRSHGDELINGTAYVREPPSPSRTHQEIVVELCRQADPVDRALTIYQLEAGNYGRGTLLELKGRTQLTAVPSVTIDWARVLAKML